ncbi:MAG: hypothetical protein PHE77_00865 [Candidatus Pacebacteria bacterium]|nr:hypothetical protein [Candidatus Paceibacterota bacterium]
MRKIMVGGVPVDDAAGIMSDFWSKIGVSISWEEFKRFLKRENPFEVVNWIDAIVAREKELHQNFFGKNFAKKFDYSQFVQTLEKYGEAKFAEWKELGLEPHFLPSVEMSQDKNFPGWNVKPNDWFYEQVDEGKILGNPCNLGGIAVLVDTRCKPAYQNGEQMWEDDNLLGDITNDLREKGEIADYKPRSSRFNISALEIEQKIASALAVKLGLEPGQVRLEKAIESNVLPQILTDTPRAYDGETNTWLWFSDLFGSAEYHRLDGGYFDNGGLADVNCGWADGCGDLKSFRLLAVL